MPKKKGGKKKGGKKKGGKKKGAKRGPSQPEGPSVFDLLKRFKRSYVELCNQSEIPPIRPLLRKIENNMADEEHLTKVTVSEESFGSVGIRCLVPPLTQYDQVKRLCLWRCNAGDEGIQSLCEYLGRTTSLEELELLDNRITPRGCGFLGRTLQHLTAPAQLATLVLDYNPFGDDGVALLTEGLRSTSMLKKLHLNYCQIGSVGGIAIAANILGNMNTIEELSLQGNLIGPPGTVAIADKLPQNIAIKSLNLADNVIGDDELTLGALRSALQANQSLTDINLDHNVIGIAGATMFADLLAVRTGIVRFRVSERLPTQLYEAIGKQVEANHSAMVKSKRGKKGGKRKKGGKKKGGRKR
eukprot:gnl/Trimastix_PCT/2164.p1 GENE.gnl/Trimastix_PCT/2164~~gnl/Trimastix_PCT/2164.p1  ORF type:complete len:357 (-),score=115.88 gnl/Trimastix_PCT/2164:149-1219(-)